MNRKVPASTGILYVIATPIGNLEDISSRAIHLLEQADLIMAEDTRHSKKLLTHLGIKTPMKSCHDFNEREVTPQILKRLEAGEKIALISDAGTPLISDPGFHLVRAALERGIRVVPIPGPSAAIAALSVAGLPVDRFVFEGFLPEKTVARRKSMQVLSEEMRTLIFYEVPHRIVAFIEDAARIFGTGRMAVLARELTKQYETISRGMLGDLLEGLQSGEIPQKGEFVVVLAGSPGKQGADETDVQRILKILSSSSLTIKEQVSITAEISGVRRNEVYKLALQLKNRS